jgi:hypothetical protein
MLNSRRPHLARRSAWLFVPTAAVLFLCLTISPPVSAITIQILSDVGSEGFPPFDPDGALLDGLAHHAADIWEDVVEDPWTVTISVQYDNVSGLASGTATQILSGKPIVGEVKIDTFDDMGVEQPWWFDPTPEDDLEFEFLQRLYRDLTPTQKSQWYGGNPPPMLEVSYRGSADSSAPPEASGGFDMLTSLVHEMGHVLGLSGSMAQSEAVTQGDFDFDVLPLHVSGNEMSVLAAGTDPANVNHWSHIAAQSLMCSACAAVGLRRQLSATDVLAVASAADWMDLDLPRKDVSGSGVIDWDSGQSWIGGAVPDAEDEVFLRDPSATGVELTGSGVAASVHIESPLVLSLSPGSTLAVAQSLTVSDGAAVSLARATTLAAGELALGDGRLEYELAGTLRGDQFGALDVAGATSLSGVLALQLVDSYQPALGDSLMLLVSAGGISGSFSSIDSTAAPLGMTHAGEPLHWLVDAAHGNAFELLVGVPGDMDLDGDIDFDDIDDFVLGLSDPGEYLTARGHGAAALGDLDGDMDLDFDDISGFTARLSDASGGSASSAITRHSLSTSDSSIADASVTHRSVPHFSIRSLSVPEPGTGELVIVALVITWLTVWQPLYAFASGRCSPRSSSSALANAMYASSEKSTNRTRPGSS